MDEDQFEAAVAEKAKAYSAMTLEELEEEAKALATQRTAIRVAQVAVDSELTIKRAVEQMDPGTRRLVKLRLEGASDSSGEGGAK